MKAAVYAVIDSRPRTADTSSTRSVAVWVRIATPPETILTAPNSPRDRQAEHDTIKQAPFDGRQRDAGKGLQARGAQAARGLLLLGSDLLQHRNHLTMTSGRLTKAVAMMIPGGIDDLQSGLLQPWPSQPVRPL